MNNLSKRITPKYLMIFTIPSILMMVFISLYTIVDGAFVSNFVNTNALSAVNIVFPFQSLALALGIMLATGGSAICARQMGEGDRILANRSFSLVVFCGCIIGFLLLVLGTVFTGSLVRLLGANDVIYQYCYDYMYTLALFAPLGILYVMFQFLFVTAGKPHLAFFTTLTGGLLNIIFDYLLIVNFSMGIRGAAIATGIGYTCPAVLGLLYFSFNKKSMLRFAKPYFSLRVLKGVLINGSSEMVSNMATAITTLLFNLIIMKHLGEDGVAAITIILYLQFLFMAIFYGYTSGMAPLVSYNFGAKNQIQLRKLYKLSVLFIFVCSAIAFVFARVLNDSVVGLFVKGDTDVFEFANKGMKLFAYSFLLMGFNTFMAGFFTALSNGKVSALLSFLRTFVFTISSILLLPILLGVNGIWLAVPLAELLAFVITIVCIIKMQPKYKIFNLRIEKSI